MSEGRAGDGAFYRSLAPWWPLISPVEDYAEEAAYIARLLRAHRPPVDAVLELGSGGGHLAFHLAPSFSLTLTDVAVDMLAMSERINPTCRHLPGDMRTLRLGETFDAVLIHDAIEYMTTETDLAAAVSTAAQHLRPGGLVVLVPDQTVESFEPGSDVGGADGPDGRGVRFLEWTWDPDPTDTWVQTEYSFVLRDANGSITAAHESHRTGLFPESTWLRVLADAGFSPSRIVEETSEDRPGRVLFLGTLRA
ncbi:MAG: class I SAM-dependent methyltransferase [Acidimicrobiales bacterium]|nr:class I SAM-dependent methyltransferase [Acidimicrobiales bacterium]